MDPPDPSGRATVPEIVIDDELHRASQAPSCPVLVVLTGPQIGERMQLDSAPIEIGRDPEADLVLCDPEVAWRHARVVHGLDGWTIHDLASAERGVEVNGMKVSRILLSEDDRVQLGATLLRYEVHSPIEQAFDRQIIERISKDDLTGLLSRRRFELELGARLEAARASGGGIGLAVLDLDHLKDINDRHGHLVGARVIAEVGKTIGRMLPASAIACRFGGDEFAIALPSASLDAIEELAARVRGAVGAMRLLHDGERLAIGISAGVALGPDAGAEPLVLLRAADEALLRAKRAGGGLVRR